jgi:hypothetical protein
MKGFPHRLDSEGAGFSLRIAVQTFRFAWNPKSAIVQEGIIDDSCREANIRIRFEVR